MGLSAEEKDRIEKLVIQALESDDPETRRVAAEAQLMSRLHNSFKRIND